MTFTLKDSIVVANKPKSRSICNFFDADEVKAFTCMVRDSNPSAYATLAGVMEASTKDDGKFMIHETYSNLQVPEKEVWGFKESYFPDIMSIQGMRSTDELIEAAKPLLPARQIYFNYSNYVITKHMKEKTYFTSPIALISDKKCKEIENPGNYFFSPVFPYNCGKIKSTSFPLEIVEYTKDSKAIYNYDTIARNKDKDFYVTQIVDEELSTRTSTDNGYIFDLEKLFYDDQGLIAECPFTMGPLSTALFNRTIVLGCVLKTWMSLRQKIAMHSKLKIHKTELEQLLREPNPTQEIKTEYKAVIDDLNLIKKFTRLEAAETRSWKMPFQTGYMKQDFGIFKVFMTLEPNSEAIHWNIVTEKNGVDTIIQRCIYSEKRIEELYRNSVLAFQYSLILNEACIEFPAFFFYMINPTPEFANELSVLWMQQQSMTGIFKKAKDIIDAKLESNILDSMHAMKRFSALLRLRSMSRDILFIETSMTRPVLKSEKYSFKAICKFFKMASNDILKKTKQAKKWIPRLRSVMTDRIDVSALKPEDIKFDASSFASQSSSALTDIVKQLSARIFLARYKPMSSGGAILELSHKELLEFQDQLDKIRSMAYEDYISKKFTEDLETMSPDEFKKYISALYQRLCGTEIPETHLLNLFFNAEDCPIFISLFVKDQTQGVREISVLNAVGKLITQFAESTIRGLSHQMKESLILDTKDRAKCLEDSLAYVNSNKLYGEIVCINGDYSAFNSYVQIPIMTSVCADAMLMAGYSKKIVDSYTECMLSYEKKIVQLKLNDIWDHWCAWCLNQHMAGPWQARINTLMKTEDLKRSVQKTTFLVEKIRDKAETYTKEIIPVIENKFNEIWKIVSEQKLQEKEQREILFFIEWPYGMSQGICGTSATIFCVLINRFFFQNSAMVQKGRDGKPNFSFVQTSDDVKVFVNLESSAFSRDFIEKWDNFSNIFGMKLSLEKTDIDIADRIIFNSNVWNITNQDHDKEEQEYEELFGQHGEGREGLFKPCRSKEEMHLGRVLKPLFMDQLSVSAGLEWSSFAMSAQIICPERGISNTQWVQTIHSLGMYLTRCTYLFYATMRDLEPEWSNIPVVMKPMNRGIIWLPQITKALRGSFRGMRASETQGIELVYASYKNSSRKDQYLRTLGAVIGSSSVSVEKMATVEFASSIMHGGSKENRSVRLLIYSLYRAFKFDMGTRTTVYPSKLQFTGVLNDKQMNLLVVLKKLEFAQHFKGMQFVDVDSRTKNVVLNNMTIKYLLEHENRIDTEQFIKTTKYIDASKISLLPIPFEDKPTQFVPRRLQQNHHILPQIKTKNPISPWVIPQLSSGSSWYKEGVHASVIERRDHVFTIYTYVNNQTISRVEVKIEEISTGRTVMRTDGVYVQMAKQFIQNQFDMKNFNIQDEQDAISAEISSLVLKGRFLVDTRPGVHKKTRYYSDKVLRLSSYKASMDADMGRYVAEASYEPNDRATDQLNED